ncbi:MAG: hypothetical protein ACJA0Q_001743, partial [Saprospiraceae bacterium]
LGIEPSILQQYQWITTINHLSILPTTISTYIVIKKRRTQHSEIVRHNKKIWETKE